MKKPILLPTKDKSVIVRNLIADGLFYGGNIEAKHRMGKCENQYLHIIDTEAEIKENDWVFVDCRDNKPNTYQGYGIWKFCPAPCPMPYWGNKDFATKIIATTDKSLNLPLINEEFVKLFVEKQGEIEEVAMKLTISGFGKHREELNNSNQIAIVTPKESETQKNKLIPLTEPEIKWIKLCKGHYRDQYDVRANDWVNSLKPMFKEIYGWDPEEDLYSYRTVIFNKLLTIWLKIKYPNNDRDLKHLFEVTFYKTWIRNYEEPIDRAIAELCGMIQSNEIVDGKGVRRYSLKLKEEGK